eukprot:CAMPEP_0197842876 /NCGR_PEP_ID=MMETSP1437-20131217/46993_1 /TAXON_ID=49252 ORGANISM="Eucampia antarctica, Strain CCMP1452" /NCGR_SAMPLE_ID=MMETSP1437 /ASSEMBLY_ACC=CAM_ASM_001096 /LENGTH=83 /DNA_ID=CAMNT_0043452821 /DNA_START=957 /DNA_END=1208 /DNA_ORIENTATION=+
MNSILDSCIYEVQFPDGSTHAYSTNVIAVNIYDRATDDGDYETYLRHIVDIRKNDKAISLEDGMFTTPSGTRRKVITTKGWEV